MQHFRVDLYTESVVRAALGLLLRDTQDCETLLSEIRTGLLKGIQQRLLQDWESLKFVQQEIFACQDECAAAHINDENPDYIPEPFIPTALITSTHESIVSNITCALSIINFFRTANGAAPFEESDIHRAAAIVESEVPLESGEEVNDEWITTDMLFMEALRHSPSPVGSVPSTEDGEFENEHLDDDDIPF